MLLYKDGRFYARYISFVLPDGCYLDSNPPFSYEYGISAWDGKKEIRLDVFEDGYSRSGNIQRDMYQYLFVDGDSYEQDSPILPAEMNGLSGYDVYYHTDSADHYEFWFKQTEEQSGVVFIQCPRGKTANVKELPLVKEFLGKIRKEKEPE